MYSFISKASNSLSSQELLQYVPPHLSTFNVQSYLKIPVATFPIHTKSKVCIAFKGQDVLRSRAHGMFLVNRLQYYPPKLAHVLFP
jgi:hypothetical protein